MTKFPCMLLVAVDLSSSDGNAIRYVFPVLWMTSCFHKKRANEPESKTTRMFRLVRQGGGSGGEVCRLRLHLVEHCKFVWVRDPASAEFDIAFPD